MASDPSVANRLEHVEEIVESIEAGDCSRSEAEALYEEGQQTMREIRNLLHGDPGKVIELE